MNDDELIQALRRFTVLGYLPCQGCGHEHQCNTHGCAIIKQALARLERLASPGQNTPLPLEELREMDMSGFVT